MGWSKFAEYKHLNDKDLLKAALTLEEDWYARSAKSAAQIYRPYRPRRPHLRSQKHIMLYSKRENSNKSKIIYKDNIEYIEKFMKHSYNLHFYYNNLFKYYNDVSKRYNIIKNRCIKIEEKIFKTKAHYIKNKDSAEYYKYDIAKIKLSNRMIGMKTALRMYKMILKSYDDGWKPEIPKKYYSKI